MQVLYTGLAEARSAAASRLKQIKKNEVCPTFINSNIEAKCLAVQSGAPFRAKTDKNRGLSSFLYILTQKQNAKKDNKKQRFCPAFIYFKILKFRVKINFKKIYFNILQKQTIQNSLKCQCHAFVWQFFHMKLTHLGP